MGVVRTLWLTCCTVPPQPPGPGKAAAVKHYAFKATSEQRLKHRRKLAQRLCDMVEWRRLSRWSHAQYTPSILRCLVVEHTRALRHLDDDTNCRNPFSATSCTHLRSRSRRPSLDYERENRLQIKRQQEDNRRRRVEEEERRAAEADLFKMQQFRNVPSK
jgi:hypothetical protein